MLDILFINTTEKNELRQEVNGTLILATKLLEAGFSADILRFYQMDSFLAEYEVFINEITDKIIKLEPKCISFYTLWPYYHILLRIAIEIKKRNSNIYVIFGGPQSSATAYETMLAFDCVDYICTGEGENTVVPFFSSILKENRKNIFQIPGLYYREKNEIKFNHIEVPLTELNKIPHWDERLINIEHDSKIKSDNYFFPIDAGRGCPFGCTFCCTSKLWKRNYRLKSPTTIISDIMYYNEKYGINSFSFSHDAFTVNKKIVSQLCDEIINNKLDIAWMCTSRIDCVDEELILKMKKSGLKYIEFGIETGSSRMQKIINKRLDLTKVKGTIDFLIKNDIDISLFFMYGFPDETEQDLNETLEMVFTSWDSGVSKVRLAFCAFNANTEMTNKHINEMVFDSNIRILSRDIYGFNEEKEMFLKNKNIFPHFYHLSTPLRNEYQYLFYLNSLYHNLPNTAKYVRKLYKGDNLKFYKDFYTNNVEFFKKEILHSKKIIRDNCVELFNNTIKDFNEPYMKYIKALLKFDYNLQKVSHSDEDIYIKEKYNFNYLEYKMNIPIEEFSNTTTEILLEKNNGIFNMKIISIDKC